MAIKCERFSLPLSFLALPKKSGPKFSVPCA